MSSLIEDTSDLSIDDFDTDLLFQGKDLVDL